jgi:hypothetical protein
MQSVPLASVKKPPVSFVELIPKSRPRWPAPKTLNTETMPGNAGCFVQQCFKPVSTPSGFKAEQTPYTTCRHMALLQVQLILLLHEAHESRLLAVILETVLDDALALVVVFERVKDVV